MSVTVEQEREEAAEAQRQADLPIHVECTEWLEKYGVENVDILIEDIRPHPHYGPRYCKVDTKARTVIIDRAWGSHPDNHNFRNMVYDEVGRIFVEADTGRNPDLFETRPELLD